ncbi:MAG: peptide-methionine (R)-S-oxide reductase [Burkholderiales bacterium]|nr:MAG: peptide-methionine (R)-S-oxide reductase [Burkholderiales bacterium]
MMTRRTTLKATFSGLASAAGLSSLFAGSAVAAGAAKTTYEVVKTDAEWQKILSPAAFNVLRKAGTERAFTSPLNDEKRAGTFHCAGCNQPLFSSKTKFDSGTGWPSFWQPLEKSAIDDVADNSLFMKRVETLCHRCGGHLGHVFDDGPKPTGLRYCMNGVALSFKPA